MVVTLVVVGIISLLAAILGACIALGVYRGQLQRIQKQQIAWERAQEGHQQTWKIKHAKQLNQLETRLGQQIQHVQQALNAWEAGDQQRLEVLQKQHKATAAQLQLQIELARLPRIEEVPASPLSLPLQQIPANWRPPQLQASNLCEQDLSHRYLAYADLRNAKLAHTNLFMADLSGAILAGAQLAGADLAGANLTGADLRGATLTGCNLLVADLHAAILLGANLLGVRNLTLEQIGRAVYDNTTQLDPEFATTRPRESPLPSESASGVDETQELPRRERNDR